MSADVYGRPWMAPRAGFEMSRKVLSAHALECLGELNTPVRTPLSLMKFSTLTDSVDAFAVCRLTPAPWSSAPVLGIG
jgi:hypothetical protein